MPDKYIRVSGYLHEKLKIKSAKLHITLKDLAESYLEKAILKEKNIKIKR